MSNVEWLLQGASHGQSRAIGERTMVDDDRWRATIERIEVGEGFRVLLTDAHAHHAVAIDVCDNRTDQWLGGQVTIAGGADIDFHDGGHTHAGTRRAMLFRPSGRRAAYSLAAGSRFHSAGWSLDIDKVARLFDGDVPPALRPLVEREVGASRFVAMGSDREMRRAALGLFSRRLNGSLRTLMLEATVLQLLALQAAATQKASAGRKRGLSWREREAVREARERLLADMRHPPSVGKLAAAVGLSERRLNAGFRAQFGVTVLEALKNERLEHARVVFEASAVPLKQVAFRVGYNHVSNFVSAFTSRYGMPPRQYQRQMSGRAVPASVAKRDGQMLSNKCLPRLSILWRAAGARPWLVLALPAWANFGVVRCAKIIGYDRVVAPASNR